MNQKLLISISDQQEQIIFQLPSAEITKSIHEDKGGEHLYLLVFDYAKDLLINNKDADEVFDDLKNYCHIIARDDKVEEIYLLISTVLEPDMIENYVGIEHGAILKIDQQGKIILDLLNKEKEAFSVVDDSELADLDLESITQAQKSTKTFVNPADALVEASKASGCDSYNRKDVLKKFKEEKENRDAS